MNGPPHDEGRPGEERPCNVVFTDLHSVADEVRCLRCHAPLTARLSVQRLRGPVCHRLATEDLLGAFRGLVERVGA